MLYHHILDKLLDRWTKTVEI